MQGWKGSAVWPHCRNGLMEGQEGGCCIILGCRLLTFCTGAGARSWLGAHAQGEETPAPATAILRVESVFFSSAFTFHVLLFCSTHSPYSRTDFKTTVWHQILSLTLIYIILQCVAASTVYSVESLQIMISKSFCWTAWTPVYTSTSLVDPVWNLLWLKDLFQDCWKKKYPPLYLDS